MWFSGDTNSYEEKGDSPPNVFRFTPCYALQMTSFGESASQYFNSSCICVDEPVTWSGMTLS